MLYPNVHCIPHPGKLSLRRLRKKTRVATSDAAIESAPEASSCHRSRVGLIKRERHEISCFFLVCAETPGVVMRPAVLAKLHLLNVLALILTPPPSLWTWSLRPDPLVGPSAAWHQKRPLSPSYPPSSKGLRKMAMRVARSGSRQPSTSKSGKPPAGNFSPAS